MAAELCGGCTSRCSGCPWAWCDEEDAAPEPAAGGIVMAAATGPAASSGSDGSGDGDGCVMLGDDPAWLCDGDECIEGLVFLCAAPSEPTLPGVRCELQPGLHKDGHPVWAC